tara:strand:- start:230 stop:388 length:159 start_codon:yes stop_codon:yes gene_type:complete
MLMNIIYSLLVVALIFFMYEVFTLVEIPPEEGDDEEQERLAIIGSMTRQHLR